MKPLLLQQAMYNVWANARVVKLMQSLPPDFTVPENSGSYTAAMGIILHIWDAEFIWLERLNGRSLTTFPSKEAGAAAFDAEKMLNCSRQLHNLVQNAGEQELAEAIEYKNLKGDNFATPRQGILMHVFNHGTFHRGQVISTLRAGGYKGPIASTDLITFLREEQ